MNLFSVCLNISAADTEKMNPLLGNYLSSGSWLIHKYVRTNHIQHVHCYFFICPLLSNYYAASPLQGT